MNILSTDSREREEWRRRRRIEVGIRIERRQTIEVLLSSRFGTLDDNLLLVFSMLCQLSDADYWSIFPQLFQISKEDLIDRFW